MRICPACGFGHTNASWRCPACGVAPASDEGIHLLAPNIAGGDGTDAAYDHQSLVAAERAHFWFRARARLIAWATNHYFPKATSLLDVGCGTGSILEELQTACPHLTLSGADALLDALRYARRRLGQVELLQIDVRHLPFAAQFDVVGAFDVLEHVDDDEHLLREMGRAMREGGGLVLTVPQHPQLWSRADEFSRHRRRYRRRDLAALVRRAGFSIRRVTSFMALMLPALVWSRARDRQRPTAFDPVAELRIGSVTNATATFVSDVERWAIQKGVSWPVGGSLLLVAVKS